MTEDVGLRLLAAIEALMAEVKVVRDEAREDRNATVTLRAIRARNAARQKDWRSREREQGQDNVTVASRRSVTVTPTLEVLDLDLKQRDQDLKQLPPTKARNATAPTAASWEAYSKAYEARHKVRPADSAAERGKLKRFLAKVPAEEAPAIAAFFLTHNDALYIRAKHPIDLLVRDAQKLRTEWLSGRQVTGAEARQQERTQTNLNGWNDLRRPDALVK